MARSRRAWVGPTAGFLAGLVFLILLFALRIDPVPALAVAAVAFVGIFLVLGALGTPDTPAAGDGWTRDGAEETLDTAGRKVEALRRMAKAAGSEALGTQITRVADVGGRILEVLEKDPGKIKAARSFLGSYLDSTLRILEKAQELQAADVDSDAARETLRKTAEILPQIETAFEAQLGRLMEGDVMDLDVEIKTLETVFRSENLGK